ncbi:MAG: N-acetyltransferase [Rhodococcus sp.]|nr:N-acetyltransferase [Rhodococcus sp. (in: high G+C Gram-positive bacteria)]
MTDISVAHAEAIRRYEIHVDDAIAGFAEYLDSDDRRIFFHTEIGEEYGGQGLGSTLIQEAVVDTIRSGKRIVPICSFVAKYLEKNPAYSEHVAEVTQEDRDLVADAAP